MENQQSDGQKREIAIIGTLEGLSRDSRRRDIIEQCVDVTTLNQNYLIFIENLSLVVDADTPAIRGFELDEIQFSAEITANGEFKLMGTGVGLEAKGGVTFTLKRKK